MGEKLNEIGRHVNQGMLKMRLKLRNLVFLGSICGTLLLINDLSWCQENHIDIDPLSVTSLRLKILHDNVEIGTATGFVLEKKSKYYLVTNRHVVLSCAQDQDQSNVGGWICADKISILHNRLGHIGSWSWVLEDLFDGQHRKRWFEHPTFQSGADIIALPLEHAENVQFYPLNLELRNADIVVGPADSVTIVGFPFGLAQQGGLAIWKTGTVASEFGIDFRGKPIFLLDTTSRPGMSGSPVYAVRSGAYRASDGNLEMSVKGAATKFLGIYSEQNQAAEIGAVWKAEALVSLYNALP